MPDYSQQALPVGIHPIRSVYYQHHQIQDCKGLTLQIHNHLLPHWTFYKEFVESSSEPGIEIFSRFE